VRTRKKDPTNGRIRIYEECKIANLPTYLIMFKPHPEEQILRHGENVPQHVNLKFVERLVDISFE
jgi:hypothetical protein